MRRYLLAGTALAIAALASPLDAATTYTYDNLGRLSIVTYDNGMQIVYTYDSAGNRTSVITQSGSVLPPVAVNDNIKVSENVANTFNPLTNDSDPQNYSLTISSVGTPAHGTATKTSSSITYTPTSGYLGADSFQYTIYDGHNSATATVFANVTNIGPVATPDFESTPMNAAITYNPLTNDAEPNPPGYTLTIQSASTPAHGTAAVNGGATLTYTPSSNFTGQDSFNYTISDGHGLTSTAAESITVGLPPVAVADYELTPVSTPITYDPLVNDSDPNNLVPTVLSTATPSHGSTSVAANGGGITYTPTNGFVGLDSFTYTIGDSKNLTGSATDYICVGSALAAPNFPVSLKNTLILHPEYPATNFDARAWGTDSCDATFIVTSVGQPLYGSASVNASGTSVTYTFGTYMSLANAFEPIVETDTFSYTIMDTYGLTSTGTVTVNIDVEYQGNQ